jgi:hypothetical protein
MPVLEWSIVAVLGGWIFLAILGPPWKQFLPPDGMETIEDLVADQPETTCFAPVEFDGKNYIVWVGRARGPIVSGPPVCVFDERGRLVDWSVDTGDSLNVFVREMHAQAFRAEPMTAEEALSVCRP